MDSVRLNLIGGFPRSFKFFSSVVHFLIVCIPQACGDGDDGDLVLDKQVICAQRSQAGEVLLKGVRRHRRIPVSVTSNATLEGKARAIAHGTWVEHPSTAAVNDFSRRIVAICKDRGSIEATWSQ